MSSFLSDTRSAVSRVERIRAALPVGGLFAGKDWRWSPDPLVLSGSEVRAIERLGRLLQQFLRVCDLFYRRSVKGSLPAWVAEMCDAGKPADLVAHARRAAHDGPDALPRVIRPDLILTEDGFALSEIDSVPGGIGLLDWLNQTYAAEGFDVLGGARGMRDGFASLADGRALDILVSEEAGDYRPEMEWLAAVLRGDGLGVRVDSAEGYRPRDARVYRFFELFDWGRIAGMEEMAGAWADGKLAVTAPMKPWLEEKLWLALLWAAPLRHDWELAMRRARFDRLRELTPFGWVMDPAPLPPHGVLPRLEAHSWSEVAGFSQTRRELVVKASGFHPLAWGARSVTVGHDVPHDEWAAAVDRALAAFPETPHVMQVFRHARVVRHRVWDDKTGGLREMEMKARLTPYYFVAGDGAVRLGGVHATLCPADKKILHGMSDAVMAPCVAGGTEAPQS